MGMAASQARLLCITARISDVEFQAQSIQNAKLQLATQSDQAYNEYMEALDAQSLVLRAVDNNGEKSTVPATFNNLCSRNHLNPAGNAGLAYALKDSRGRLIVEDEIAAGYQNFVKDCNYKNAEAFAMYMLYGKEAINVQTAEKDVWNELVAEQGNNADQDVIPDQLESIRQSIEEMLGHTDIYDTSGLDSSKRNTYEKAMENYRELLYKHFGDRVATKTTDIEIDKESFDKNTEQFNYYTSIYNQIEANGGAIIAISKFDGFDGMAANDPEWLTSMVQSGLISIEMVKEDEQGNTVFNGTSPSSDSSLRYDETTSVDPTAAKKAEAKYENTLKQIQVKDKKFDLSLSKLEAERESLTKQRDSLKKVIKENIEKSFGIFS